MCLERLNPDEFKTSSSACSFQLLYHETDTENEVGEFLIKVTVMLNSITMSIKTKISLQERIKILLIQLNYF